MAQFGPRAAAGRGAFQPANAIVAQRPEAPRAVIVTAVYRYDEEFDNKGKPKNKQRQLPREVKDTETEVFLRPGEPGISFASKRLFESQTLYHQVKFERHGKAFSIAVPETHLQIGAKARFLNDMLADLEELSRSVPNPVDDKLLQWSRKGSKFDRYVKALWIGIRERRDTLEMLGLVSNTASRMFERQYFVPSVEKICRLFRPRFKEAMESPNQTAPGLVARCDHLQQNPEWPADEVPIIYVRVYPRLEGGNETGVYVGYTGHAVVRDDEHNRKIQGPRNTNPSKPTHYDVAKLARQCHVLIVLCPQGTENFGGGGTPELRTMTEQTVMLMLRSYAPWIAARRTQDLQMGNNLHYLRARLLQAIESRVRDQTGFQPGWTVRGTNVLSPLFDFFQHDDAPREVALMQTTTALRPHPSAPNKTVARAVVRFTKTHKELGAKAFFRGHRVGSHRPVDTVSFLLPVHLTPKIRQTIEISPSTEPFFATLVFELMERGEHERPYYGLPTTGPYKDFGAVRALGIRVEWKHHTLPKWFSAPLQVHNRRLRHVQTAMLKGDSSSIELLYQEATALIQMVRSEHYPQSNALKGFWRSLSFRGSQPLVRRFEIDHLRQTARWVTSVATPTACPPAKSSFGENRDWLCDNRDELSRFMAVGQRPEMGDALWFVDLTSASSVKKGWIRCDTCRIFATRRASFQTRGNQPCDYSPETHSCTTCTTLNRPCTFTPATKLLAAWVGEEDADYKDYSTHGQTVINLPNYSSEPIRQLVPHLGMPEEEAVTVEEIQEPFGWQSLYAAIDCGELEDDEQDELENDGEDEFDDEEEE